MRIAVCDDNALDREMIRDLLSAGFSGTQLSPEFTLYESGHNLVDDIQDGMWFDVVFLDIYMEDHLGIDTARRLRELEYSGEIVFLTASPDFAIDGYDVSAAGYILKPISMEKLAGVVSRVTRNLEERTYTVNQRTKIVRVPLAEILYVESSNTKCILHRADGSGYTIYKRLDGIEQELNDKRFLRCHQSYLVNMDYVRQVDKQVLLTTGEVVLVRQRNQRAIRQAYLAYTTQRKRERGEPEVRPPEEK